MVLVTTAEGEAFRLQFYAFVTPTMVMHQRRMSIRPACLRGNRFNARKKREVDQQRSWSTNENRGRVVFRRGWWRSRSQRIADKMRNARSIELNITRSTKINFQSRGRSFGDKPNLFDFFPPGRIVIDTRIVRQRIFTTNTRPIFYFFFLFNLLQQKKRATTVTIIATSRANQHRQTAVYRSHNVFVCSLNKFCMRTTTH